ncbi:hypothetical protein [Natronococcus roseus]|uniref:hypothetical protein n=1 Tax=Natronococcus roseus TaxID=1052014 RepID=UPI00374DB0B4
MSAEFGDTNDQSDREEILSFLFAQIEFTHEHLEEMDLDSREDEELAIKWMRTLGSLSGQYRLLTKDKDIDEMQDELDFLQLAEEAQSND